VAPEPFGDGVRDLEECSGRVSEESAARTYCRSGRTWTLLAIPVRGEREKGGRKAGWPGFPHSGKERARTEGESGKAGVASQWEGTGQEEKEKAGWPGFPHSWKERARGEESGMSTRSEAESELEVGSEAGLEAE
jgi:hypothetical protein